MIERDDTLFAQQQVVRLQALLEASRQIHSTIALDEVLVTVLKIVVRELELTGALFTHFAHTYGDLPEALATRRAGPATPGDVLAAWQDPEGLLVVRNFPLLDKEGEAFTELVAVYPAERDLSLDEVDFLESLSIQAAVAIENARFHERTVQWQKLASDMASARQVQRSLLPQSMPKIDGYTLAMKSVACYAVGGDYVDIVPMPDGRTMIVVADVAGKGLASALVSVSFRSAFRAMVNTGVPLVEVATRMNLLHYGEGQESRRRYVTAIFVELHPASNSVEVVNAGHNPAFLVTGCSEDSHHEMHKIGASGTPVGMLPFSTYALEKYALPRGARLLLYTDGLTEVFRGEEEFGEARLLKALEDCEATSAESVLESLWGTLDAFSDEEEQSDDMTALVLLREG